MKGFDLVNITDIVSTSKKSMVTYSNALAEASYDLGVMELKFVYGMASFISPDDVEFKTYRIYRKAFAEYMNIDRKTALNSLDKITDNIMNSLIKIPRFTPDGKPSILKTHWTAHCEITEDYIEFSFNEKLRPYLLGLRKDFNSHSYYVMSTFKGKFTSRIYSLLHAYKYLKVYTCKYDRLREMFEIPDGKYEPFKSFRQWVLNAPKKEMDKKDKNGNYISDISFEIETIKKGRFVDEIKFIIKKNKVNKEIIDTSILKKIDKSDALGLYNEETKEYESSVLLIELGFKKSNCKRIVSEYSFEEIKNCHFITKENYIKKGKVDTSPQAIMVGLLKSGAGKEKPKSMIEKEKQDKKAKDEYGDEYQNKIDSRRTKLRNEFSRKRRSEFIENLSPEEESKILSELKTVYQDTNHIIQSINKDGLRSMIISNEIINRIPNYEEEKEAYVNSKL